MPELQRGDRRHNSSIEVGEHISVRPGRARCIPTRGDTPGTSYQRRHVRTLTNLPVLGLGPIMTIGMAERSPQQPRCPGFLTTIPWLILPLARGSSMPCTACNFQQAGNGTRCTPSRPHEASCTGLLGRLHSRAKG